MWSVSLSVCNRCSFSLGITVPKYSGDLWGSRSGVTGEGGGGYIFYIFYIFPGQVLLGREGGYIFYIFPGRVLLGRVHFLPFLVIWKKRAWAIQGEMGGEGLGKLKGGGGGLSRGHLLPPPPPNVFQEDPSVSTAHLLDPPPPPPPRRTLLENSL